MAVMVMACVLGAAGTGLGEVRIDGEFAGGNIVVDVIQEDVVRLHQDRRDTEGWWFYWYFRATGAAGRTLRFDFTDGEPIGVRGPAISRDGGKTWAWLGAKAGNKKSFTYQFAAGENEVRFAYTIPYLQSEWAQFIEKHKGNAALRPGTLCRSRKGRAVECAYVGVTNGEPRHRVLIMARHHACEAMASYALEGLLETVLAGETEEGRWLANNVEFMAVPFVDKDGVEDGDQGKNRRPRDHNRDYEGKSVHAETAALRKVVPEWGGEKLHVAMDLHCPWIRGPRNEVIYIVGSEDPAVWKEQQRLGEILQKVAKGPLPYRASDNLAYGKEWNTGNNYGQGKSSMRWAGELPGMKLAVSFEIPYANASGKEVNPESARAFGADLARALAEYLRSVRR